MNSIMIENKNNINFDEQGNHNQQHFMVLFYIYL